MERNSIRQLSSTSPLVQSNYNFVSFKFTVLLLVLFFLLLTKSRFCPQLKFTILPLFLFFSLSNYDFSSGVKLVLVFF
ncbi:hypothetical protein HanRHA438_Chr12g0550041 [Helianthus annuus]|nr:hypothetical protein HanIR_Chr12g0580721 [Helianthus annuus]KAJ0866288.1 hypothetical protein HanRHA438_Chr12g0550041 [Helianthus annuus]